MKINDKLIDSRKLIILFKFLNQKVIKILFIKYLSYFTDKIKYFNNVFINDKFFFFFKKNDF